MFLAEEPKAVEGTIQEARRKSIMAETREFCSICGVVLSAVFYKCKECGEITCPACQNTEDKKCIDCAPTKPQNANRELKPNARFTRPMRLSPQLAQIVGEGPMPRTEVTKQMWVYIKRHGLQDSENKRMINADEKLAALFNGKKQVNMFEMTTLVAKHILK